MNPKEAPSPAHFKTPCQPHKNIFDMCREFVKACDEEWKSQGMNPDDVFLLVDLRLLALGQVTDFIRATRFYRSNERFKKLKVKVWMVCCGSDWVGYTQYVKGEPRGISFIRESNFQNLEEDIAIAELDFMRISLGASKPASC